MDVDISALRIAELEFKLEELRAANRSMSAGVLVKEVMRLREAIQKWYDYGYNRGEAEKLLEGEHVES